MGRKRRQRSTAIRKRIEKKQREAEKQARREAKRSGRDREIMLTMTVDAQVATACATALQDLDSRLASGPIRGWSQNDFSGDNGLTWFAGALQEAGEGKQGATELEVDRAAQQELLNQLNALEMAASGLDLDWEVGFLQLARSLSHAEEPPPPEEDEDEDED